MHIYLNPEPAVDFIGKCKNNDKNKKFSPLCRGYCSITKGEKEKGNKSGRAHAEAICDVIFDNPNHNLPWAIKF